MTGLRWVLNKLGINNGRAKTPPTGDSGDQPPASDTSSPEKVETPTEAEREGLGRMVEDRLQSCEDVWGSGEELTVAVASFNVAEKLPNFNDHTGLRKWLLADADCIPDIFAVGLQEIDMSVATILLESSSSKGSIWSAFVESIIQEKAVYTPLEPCTIGGLLLLVFVHEKHTVHSVSTASVKVGYQGNLANKGAAALRVSLKGRTVLLVNSHLEAHENRKTERNKGYKSILSGLTFGTTRPSLKNMVWEGVQSSELPKACRIGTENSDENGVLQDVDYAFWFGDLNYRVRRGSEGESRTNYPALLHHDELKQMLFSDQVFLGWKEGVINFPPTYKYVLNSNEFSAKRRPAWTDRILYYEKPSARGSLSTAILPPASHLLHQNQLGFNSPATQDSFFSCLERDKDRKAYVDPSISPVISRGPSVITAVELSPPGSPPCELASTVNVPLKYVQQVVGSYKSFDVMLSDHRPVLACFKIGCVTPDPLKARDFINNDEEIQKQLHTIMP
eukprot:TRINITY_DN8206_c0_g1_i1.p1 TRINITY_DN8206_c0_g1~~TRINITY_DN8206_c0_g1_i1.p1  ORF type:complete len:506 (+),score=46.73 TRINITY_DN8206_c0_g1_i1:512-2029(+)